MIAIVPPVARPFLALTFGSPYSDGIGQTHYAMQPTPVILTSCRFTAAGQRLPARRIRRLRS